ncbi:hypothetical protein, partial [Salmonella sp. ZJJH19_0138]|uniref:hypothetical protein n=1 Tax=Salmonella sp. ZJJH19_0138 TaxID=3159614 RepID=UPI00397FD956
MKSRFPRHKEEALSDNSYLFFSMTRSNNTEELEETAKLIFILGELVKTTASFRLLFAGLRWLRQTCA